jgi:transcriptional regulator with XRE-family HTH domain
MMSMRTTKAAENLAGWIAVRRLSHEEVAGRLGCSRPYLTNILGGAKTPSGKLQKAIQDLTGGAVAMPDWYMPVQEAPDAAA